MKFLDTPNACVKERRARLLLDLYDLMHQARGTGGHVGLEEWKRVRGHDNKPAALRDLYRTKDLLEGFRVELDFGTEEDGFAVDMTTASLRALVKRELDEATQWLAARGFAPAIDRSVRASVEAFTRANKGMEGFEDALAVHEAAARAALSRLIGTRDEDSEGPEEMMSSCNMTQRRLRVTWTRKTGPRPVEASKPAANVEKAIVVARSKSAFKVKLVEIGALLDCSPRTAARFVKRVCGGPASSEDRKR